MFLEAKRPTLMIVDNTQDSDIQHNDIQENDTLQSIILLIC